MFWSKNKNPIQKQYGAVVVGTGVGGLISGALLAKRGERVLVLNQEQVPHSFPVEGFSIQRESITGQGFKRYLFEAIFEELGVRPHERTLFERSQPVFQVVQSKHRLDVGGEREPLLEEYRREFPHSIDAIARLYQAFDDYFSKMQGHFSREDLKEPLRKSKKFLPLRRAAKAQSLRELMNALNLPLAFQSNLIAQVSFLSHVHTEHPSLAQTARVLATTHRKDYFFLGDSKELAQIFYDRILEAGGSVREDATVDRILLDGGKVLGARLTSYEGVVGADAFIGNMEIHRLFDLMEGSRKLRSSRSRLLRVKPRYAKCTFFIGLEERVLPVGMRNHLVLVGDENKPLMQENFIEVGIFREKDASPKRLLHASFYLPYPTEEVIDREAFHQLVREVAQRVLEKIRWLVPYLDKHLLLVFPDISVPTAPDDRVMERYALLHGAYDWPSDTGARESLGLFPNETALSNFYFTGPEVFPALGFEGETLSSINVANLASRQIQKNRGVKVPDPLA